MGNVFRWCRVSHVVCVLWLGPGGSPLLEELVSPTKMEYVSFGVSLRIEVHQTWLQTTLSEIKRKKEKKMPFTNNIIRWIFILPRISNKASCLLDGICVRHGVRYDPLVLIDQRPVQLQRHTHRRGEPPYPILPPGGTLLSGPAPPVREPHWNQRVLRLHRWGNETIANLTSQSISQIELQRLCDLCFFSASPSGVSWRDSLRSWRWQHSQQQHHRFLPANRSPELWRTSE